jgi:large subunit ribosomal protein L9
MRVILTSDVKQLGAIGDVLNVKDGYARNFLIPRSLAVVANESNKAEFDHRKKVLDAKKAKILVEMKKLASSLEKASLTIAKQVGEDERIFGTVTTAEIEEALDKAGHKVSRKDIKIEDIKKVGVYEAHINLHHSVSAKVKVWVVAQQ